MKKDEIIAKINTYAYMLKQEKLPDIIIATQTSDINKIKASLAKGVDVNGRDQYNQNALFFATNYNVMKLLIEHGADVNIVSKNNTTLLNARSSSTFHSSYQATKLLVDNGFKKELLKIQRKYSLEGPLHNSDKSLFATKDYADGEKNVKLLIGAGADINIKNRDAQTPIFTVNDKSKKILMEHGADIFILTKNNQNLLFRVKELELFKELVDRGLDISQRNSKGQIPLHFSLSDGIVNFILSKGVDINTQDNEGRSPIFHRLFSPEKLNLFFENGANINLTNLNGETALHFFVKRYLDFKNKNILKSINVLLKNNIDVNIKNNNGQTALAYTDNKTRLSASKIKELKDLLISYEAK